MPTEQINTKPMSGQTPSPVQTPVIPFSFSSVHANVQQKAVTYAEIAASKVNEWLDLPTVNAHNLLASFSCISGVGAGVATYESVKAYKQEKKKTKAFTLGTVALTLATASVAVNSPELLLRGAAKTLGLALAGFLGRHYLPGACSRSVKYIKSCPSIKETSAYKKLCDRWQKKTPAKEGEKVTANGEKKDEKQAPPAAAPAAAVAATEPAKI